MIKQKVSGMLAILTKQLKSGKALQIWCVERVLHGIRTHFTGNEMVESLWQCALSLFSSTDSPFTRLALLRITQRLLPLGIPPTKLSEYLKIVADQQPYFGSEWRDEWCVVIAQILASAAGMMIPRRDLAAIESNCSFLLDQVLRADDGVVSLAIHSIVAFIKYVERGI